MMDTKKMASELEELIGEWWQDQDPSEVPTVGNKTFGLMAHAAMIVLCAVEEIQQFIRED